MVSDSLSSAESILSDSITGVSIEGNPDDGLDGPVVRGRRHAVADTEIERPGLALDLHHRIQRPVLLVARQPVRERADAVVVLHAQRKPLAHIVHRLPGERDIGTAAKPGREAPREYGVHPDQPAGAAVAADDSHLVVPPGVVEILR